MLTVWITLIKYPYSIRTPASTLFVHTPMRMFLLFLVNMAIWENGLIALKWYKSMSPDHRGKWEPEHEEHAWIAFGVITSLGLLSEYRLAVWKSTQADVVNFRCIYRLPWSRSSLGWLHNIPIR